MFLASMNPCSGGHYVYPEEEYSMSKKKNSISVLFYFYSEITRTTFPLVVNKISK